LAVEDTGAATTVPVSFSAVVVIEGAGTMEWADGIVPLTRGDAFVVPHAVGPLTFSPGVTAVVSQPPAPDAPEPDERGPQ
jgi:mannose-6-phosphate isomerase